MSVSGILAGSNEEDLLYALYLRNTPPSNASQKLYGMAWEIDEFISSDGFEWIFEQPMPIEEFVRVFREIGFHDAGTMIDRAATLVGQGQSQAGNSAEFQNRLRSQFEPLKSLLYEYLELSNSKFFQVLGEYVRNHKSDFVESSEDR